MTDTTSHFCLARDISQSEDQECALTTLQSSYHRFYQRFDTDESQWLDELQAYLDDIERMRIVHVAEWLRVNTSRFQIETESPFFEDVRRLFSDLSVTLHANIQVCGAQCVDCQLLCLRPKFHSGGHNCNTRHCCMKLCEYTIDHHHDVPCGLPYVLVVFHPPSADVW